MTKNDRPAFGFEVLQQDGAARRGRLTSGFGVVDTPAFMPVGTAASVKAMMPEQVASTGAQIILSNTYHLMLRPGPERVERLGGVRKLMGWDGPLLTDSGGFQVMSLGPLRNISEEGVSFKSHLDGSIFDLTPERSTQIQHMLDATITMAFDECTPFPATYDEARASMELSMRWAARSRSAYVARTGYGQFGIVQGSVFEDLRHLSIKALTDIGFEGYAIGGLAVGEGQEAMFSALNVTCPAMPPNKPRYLMGVGKPADIVGAVQRGVDMFDCVLPSRAARHGTAYTRQGKLNIRNERFRDDLSPLEGDGDCYVSREFSKSYLRHLFMTKESLGGVLLTMHNLRFFVQLMEEARMHIAKGTFAGWSRIWIETFSQGLD